MQKNALIILLYKYVELKLQTDSINKFKFKRSAERYLTVFYKIKHLIN